MKIVLSSLKYKLSLINVKIDSAQLQLNYIVMLNGYSQWFDIQGENNFIETSVVLISMMLAYKKYAINEI